MVVQSEPLYPALENLCPLGSVIACDWLAPRITSSFVLSLEMPQLAHPRFSGDKNQDPEEGCLFGGGVDEISQPSFQLILSGSHGASYMKENSS